MGVNLFLHETKLSDDRKPCYVTTELAISTASPLDGSQGLEPKPIAVMHEVGTPLSDCGRKPGEIPQTQVEQENSIQKLPWPARESKPKPSCCVGTLLKTAPPSA